MFETISPTRDLANVVETIENKESSEEEITNFLEKKGHNLVRPLGEGKTRTALLSQYSSGAIKTLRVVKVPFEEYDPESVCTMINMSKGDLDENEATILSQISHPNIVTIIDNYKYKNITINVEEYFQNAQSLEEIVKTSGKITDQNKIKSIFSQILEGVGYINHLQETGEVQLWGNRGILHRDIKPSNILIGIDGLTKLTDFQNASRIENIQELTLPTRGGTAYTHPELINSLVTGNKSKATRQTEAYAVGATLFYALTGENMFNYNIKDLKTEQEQKEGSEIMIGSKKHFVQLYVNGEKQDVITKELHDKNLKKGLKKVPKKYRKIIKKALNFDEENAYSSVLEIKYDFEKANRDSKKKVLDKICAAIKPTMMTVGSIGLLGGIILLGQYIGKLEPPRPSLAEVLRNQDYRSFSLETWNNEVDSLYTMDLLKPHFSSLEKNLSGLLEKNERGRNTRDWRYISNVVSHSYNVHAIDKRIMTALMASCYINGWEKEDVDKIYNEKNQQNKRLPITYVPVGFAKRIDRTYGNPTDLTKGAYAAMYLKAGIAGANIGGEGEDFSNRGTVADVFASYFCSNEEINTARIRTESINFFPTINGSSLDIGYAQFLPREQKNLIKNAVAVYKITDEDGNIDLDKIPKLKGLHGQYKSTLFLPPN